MLVPKGPLARPIITDDLTTLTRRYACVVADPPWPYKGAGPVGSGSRGINDGSMQVNARERYNLMSMDELCALPIPVADNAHLYLWTTNAFMVEAHDLVQAWGFRPVTILTWVKVKKDDPNSPSMKAGYYFRGATEHVLFGVRGSLPLRVSKGQPTAFLHPRLPHSQKPDAFMEWIERCSPGPRLEMFSRRSRPGWDAFGNQVDAGQPD